MTQYQLAVDQACDFCVVFLLQMDQATRMAKRTIEKLSPDL